MATLTTKKRQALPSAAFVYPPSKANPDGKYPIHDKAHAANAMARVMQNGTPAEKKKVLAMVCKKYPDLPSCKGVGDGKAAKAMKTKK